MPVDPTRGDVRRFVSEDDGGPVAMLNLLRFADGGRASYDRYIAAATPAIENAGARTLYAGDCSTPLVANDGQDWDAVLLIWYPSRAAFLTMIKDPAYQAITHLRAEGLEDAVLQATTPWSPDPGR